MAENPLDERALLGKLADRARFTLLGVNVTIGARDVHVAAQNQPASVGCMRRLKRRFAEVGGIWRMSTEATLRSDIELFLRLHSGRWAGRGGSASA